MAIYNTQVTVTTTAQVIVNLDNVTQYVTLHSKGATYIGNSAVTSTNGLHVENGDTVNLVLPEGCDLWAIASSGTHTLAVLTARVD
jgi:hypothetical protein